MNLIATAGLQLIITKYWERGKQLLIDAGLRKIWNILMLELAHYVKFKGGSSVKVHVFSEKLFLIRIYFSALIINTTVKDIHTNTPYCFKVHDVPTFTKLERPLCWPVIF